MTTMPGTLIEKRAIFLTNSKYAEELQTVIRKVDSGTLPRKLHNPPSLQTQASREVMARGTVTEMRAIETKQAHDFGQV